MGFHIQELFIDFQNMMKPVPYFINMDSRTIGSSAVVLNLFLSHLPLNKIKKLILPLTMFSVQGMTFLKRVRDRFSWKNVVNFTQTLEFLFLLEPILG